MKFLLKNLCFQRITCSTQSTSRINLVFGYVVCIHILESTMVILHVVIAKAALSALFFKGGECPFLQSAQWITVILNIIKTKFPLTRVYVCTQHIQKLG
jgi:hypothetical protein